MTTSWGYYMQGSDQQIEIEELGSRLSKEIGCPVHFLAFGKPLFECMCGVIFPLYILKVGDWNFVKERHIEERLLFLEMTDG